MQGNCRLCLEIKDLQLSHIIPKFVFRYIKDSSVGGIRNTQAPNLRIQDGEKRYLLCRECELLLSKWENIFSKQVFLPLHDPSPVTRSIEYGPWAMKFAVSVSWRVLMYFIDEGFSGANTTLQHEIEKAKEMWRLFLLDKKPNTKKYEIHLLPVDVIESTNNLDISPYLNRYLLRSTHMDIISSDKEAFVYTKLGRLLLFGFIHEEQRHQWRGTKLHVGNAKIHPREYHVPGWVGKYLNDKANQVREKMGEMSEAQRGKVDAMIQEHLDEIGSSEGFRAMEYDVMHSGNKAFRKP